MRRRDFITLIGGAVAAWPLAAHAQEPGRIYRLGNLHVFPRQAPWYVALFDELRRHGFIEGQNLSVDEHGYGLRVEQLAEHASELVRPKSMSSSLAEIRQFVLHSGRRRRFRSSQLQTTW